MQGGFFHCLEQVAPAKRPAPGGQTSADAHPAPDTDPSNVLELAALCLQRQRSRDSTSYRVNQSAQALAGSLQRLAASNAVPDRMKQVLASRMGELALLQGPGPSTEAAAGDLTTAIIRTGEALSGCLPGTAHALLQAKADAGYLLQAAAEQKAGEAPAPNRIAVEALRLMRETNAAGRAAGPNGPILDSLRAVAGTLLSLSANAGGSEMPIPVQQSLVALLLGFAAVIQSETPLMRASTDLAAGLRTFAASLRQATGGSYGTQHSLVSLMHDLGTLGAAVQQRLSGVRPSIVTVH